MLIGSLGQGALVRVATGEDEVTDEEVVPLGACVRDVAQGPDGLVCLLTDQGDGKVWRLAPLPEGSRRRA